MPDTCLDCALKDMKNHLKKLTKTRITAICALLAVVFFISVFFAFSHKLLEHVLVSYGQENARIGSVDYGVSGTAVRDIDLPRLGLHIDEAMLYATVGDFAGARLTKIDIRGLRWQSPDTAPAGNAALPDADDLRKTIQSLDLHSREITITDGRLMIADGVTLDLAAQIFDRGERTLANFQIKSLREETGSDTAITLDASGSAELFTGTGAAKLQVDVAGLDVASPDLVLKRLNGWLTAEVPATGDNLLLSGQLAAGSLRAYGLPLTQAAITLSGDAARFQALATARLPAEGKTASENMLQADITVERPPAAATDKISATLAADMTGLQALGIDGLGGGAKVDARLSAEKPRDAGYADLARYSAISGTLDAAASKLSLKSAVRNAEAKAALSLDFDPAQKILHLRQRDKTPLTLKMTRDGATTDIRIGTLDAAYAVDAKTLRMTAGDAAANLAQVSVKGLAADMTAMLGDAPVAEGKITLNEIASTEKPAVFTPLKGTITLRSLSSEQGATGATLALNGQNGALVIKGDGRYSGQTKTGSFRLRMTPLNLQKGIYDLDDFFPVAGQYVQDVTGTVAARADIDWRDGHLSSRGGVMLKDVGAVYADFPVEGINSVVKFDSLMPLTFSRQTLAVGAFTAGLPLQNGVVVLSLDAKGRATLHDGRMNMAGGQVFVTPFSMDIEKRQGQIILNASNLDLGQLFAIAPLEGLAATGKVAGRLPLQVSGDTIILVDGVLESSGSGGALRYNPAELPAFLADDSNPRIVDLRIALANFNFAKLRMVLNGDLVKEQRIALNIEGKNPDFYGGHPVKLNLNVEGPLQNILKYAPGSSSIPDAIEQQIEQFEENNAAAAQ